MHPQDRVLPDLKLAPGTAISLPHEHVQDHHASLRCGNCALAVTVRRPNTWLVMSINFRAMVKP